MYPHSWWHAWDWLLPSPLGTSPGKTCLLCRSKKYGERRPFLVWDTPQLGQPSPATTAVLGIIPFAFDRRHWLDFISNRSTPYAQQMMLAASTATSKIMRSAEYRALVLLSRPYWIMVDCNGLRTPYDYQFMWTMQYTHPSPLVLRKVRWELTWSKSLVLVKISTMFGLHAVAHRWSANNHLKARFPLFPSWILEKKLLINMSFFPSSIPTGINIVILVGPSNVRGWKFRDRKQNTTSPLDLLFEPVSHRGTMYSVLRRHQILQSSDDRRQGTVGAEVSGPARWRCSGVVMLCPHWVMFASALVVWSSVPFFH